jgi:hypothetical protein
VNTQGSAAAQQLGGGSGMITEVMPYPVTPSSADAAAAADSSSVTIQ